MLCVRSVLRNVLVLLAMAAAIGSCDSTGPGTIEDVRNSTDDFRFDLPRQNDFSGTLRYAWSNTGSASTITISTVPTSGIGTLTLQDEDGKIVFSGSVRDAGTFTTESGRAGSWVVSVLLVRIAGRLTFRLQKASS